MSDIADEDYYDCYDDEDDPVEQGDSEAPKESSDPEHFSYNPVSEDQVLRIIQAAVEDISKKISVSNDVAKNLLIQHNWNFAAIVQSDKPASKKLLDTRITLEIDMDNGDSECAVCLEKKSFHSMPENFCGHRFCADCWNLYLNVQVDEGKEIQCMETKCDAFVGEDFTLRLLRDEKMREKFHRQLFRNCVKKNPNLSLCPTNGCGQVFFADHAENKRVICDKCQADFCFSCGCEYHLPCDCRTIRHWWNKVCDDADTASYMASHTKDCPSCESNIEKNGGCNHMICRACKYEFCWICREEWKQHGTSYYDCNKFSAKKAEAAAEKADAAGSTGRTSQARLALNKYLFYFQRWKNHEQSLHLEQNLFKQIEDRVQTKVKNREGSLIDWQYLMDAGKLLLKCRRALQYTYALAYYLEDGPQRMLFEHLQAELESGIENLSFSIERAETVNIAGLQAQMRSAEFRRCALFRDAKTLTVPAPGPSS